MTEPSGGLVDTKVRAALELLCGLIISAEDPVTRGEAQAGRVREQLLGKLGAASTALARIERELELLRGMAGAMRRSGRGLGGGSG